MGWLGRLTGADALAGEVAVLTERLDALVAREVELSEKDAAQYLVSRRGIAWNTARLENLDPVPHYQPKPKPKRAKRKRSRRASSTLKIVKPSRRKR
jgi:hypothetical protein